MNKPVYVLGTGLSHDGSACLLKNGRIVVAIEKERITRRKHDGGNDDDAIKYCLEAENIKLSDVQLIVQCGSGRLNKEGYHYLGDGPEGRRMVMEERSGVPLVTLSHHLAHAYNAIGTSPFEEMAILVIDGSGQEMKYCIDLEPGCLPQELPDEYAHLCFEKDSFYYFKDGHLTTIYKDFSPFTELWLGMAMFPVHMAHSIGDIYEQASTYCLGTGAADRGVQQAGKLMGLAPYGRPGVYDHRIFELKDGRVFINYGWQRHFNRPCRSYIEFKRNFQYYADIAYWVQKEAERAIFYVIDHRSGLCATKNLAYTGGVALNAVANNGVLANSRFENLYMTPAAGDNGLSIGCAYFGWLKVLNGERVRHNGNACFGRIYSDEEIRSAIAGHEDFRYLPVPETLDAFFEIIPSYCQSNNIEGTFHQVQLIIKDVGMYAVSFAHGKWTIVRGVAERPHGTIIADGISFIQWMLGFSHVENLLSEGKVVLEGDVSAIAYGFGQGIVKVQMHEVIYGPDGTARGYMKMGNGLRSTKEADIAASAAKLLAEGKVIGWFQGGSEFGPRALGHRSILADPRKKHVREFINARVKLREDFRPFAPSVLLEDAAVYFKYEGESPYMILVVDVRPEWREEIPAVVHQDGSCRIQTVTPQWNELYYNLLKEFKELTGVSILLNTSFNRRGMPVVETPWEAMRLFAESELDCLVMHDHIIYKTQHAAVNGALNDRQASKLQGV